MNQLPNAIDIAKEAIKANPGLIKDCQESVDLLTFLMINYRTDMNYWGSLEHIKEMEKENSNVPEVFTDIFKQFGFKKP